MSVEEDLCGAGGGGGLGLLRSYCLVTVFECWLLSDPGRQRRKPSLSAICSSPARPPPRGDHSDDRDSKCAPYTETLKEILYFTR